MVDFTVEGRLPFPIEMLRFDECWPVGTQDAADIEASHYVGQPMTQRRIRLRSSNQYKPTPKRWDSFCWMVVEIDGVPHDETR